MKSQTNHEWTGPRLEGKEYDKPPTSMLEDPAYPNAREFEGSVNVSGYRYLNEDPDGVIDAIGGNKGEVATYMHVGDYVKVKGGSLSGRIIKLLEPSIDGRTDIVVIVTDMRSMGALKPSQLEVVYMPSPEVKAKIDKRLLELGLISVGTQSEIDEGKEMPEIE